MRDHETKVKPKIICVEERSVTEEEVTILILSSHSGGKTNELKERNRSGLRS